MTASLLKQRKGRPVRSEGPLVLLGALAVVAAIALATYPGDLEIIERPAMAHDGAKGRAWDLQCRPTSVLEAYSIARRRC
jgi:hypothetical protein